MVLPGKQDTLLSLGTDTETIVTHPSIVPYFPSNHVQYVYNILLQSSVYCVVVYPPCLIICLGYSCQDLNKCNLVADQKLLLNFLCYHLTLYYGVQSINILPLFNFISKSAYLIIISKLKAYYCPTMPYIVNVPKMLFCKQSQKNACVIL